MSNTPQQGLSTLAVHAGYQPEAATGAVNVPIYATSTFAQDGIGHLRGGFEYSRTANPTRSALEAAIAQLENGRFGRAFSSGMAAIDCALRALLSPGDHLIIPNDAYGGTFRLVDTVLTRWGISYTPVALSNLEALHEAFRPTTRVVWIETPTNPLLSIADIKAISTIAHDHDARVVVDNTFASPALQQPLTLGADMVIHSMTKYLGGHSDVVAGALVTNCETLDHDIGFLQNSAGAILGPFDAYLTLRGIKTLMVRMQRHCDNAMILAEFLDTHTAVSQVLYPGLSTHPDHQIAARQMHGFGGMISIRMRKGLPAAQHLCAHTHLFTLGESLGGVESLIEHPWSMTHASTTGSQLEVPQDLVRLSVGIEDIHDLVADLEQALE